MKKLFILLIACIHCFSVAGQQQEATFFFKGGVGYFANIEQVLRPGFGDVPNNIQINPDVEGETEKGYATWIDFSHKLASTGFIVSGSVTSGITKYEYNDGLGIYWDFKQQASYLLLDLAFGRNLAIKKHEFTPYLGMTYRRFFSSFADYDVGRNTSGAPAPFFPTIIQSKFEDLGMSFKIDYAYLLHPNLSFGLRTGTNLAFALGFETIIISPFVCFRF